MIKSIYEFDPFNLQDVKAVLEMLKKHHKDEFERVMRFGSTGRYEQNSSIEVLVRQKTELEEKVRTLQARIDEQDGLLENQNQTIKLREKDSKKIQAQLEDRDKENEILQLRIAELEKQLAESQEKVKESEGLLAMAEEDSKAKLQEKDAAYRKLERDSINERNAKEKEIESLKSKLLAYEPNIGGNVGEEKLFTIDESASTPTLIETNAADAPYIVRISDNGTVSFQFNYDKGPSATACVQRQIMLEPFCQILNPEEEGSGIRPAGHGIAKLSPSGDIRATDIIKKAQIKLVRI